MYTKAPWSVEKNGNSFYVTALGFYDVAVVRAVGGEDNAANAKLIAASPQLVEYLATMTELCKLKYGNLDPEVYAYIEKCEVLLKSLSGEE